MPHRLISPRSFDRLAAPGADSVEATLVPAPAAALVRPRVDLHALPDLEPTASAAGGWTRRAAMGALIGGGGALLAAPGVGRAQGFGLGGDGPLRVTVSGGQFKPIPITLPPLFAETDQQAEQAAQIGEIIRANLTRSGLFQIVENGSQAVRVDVRPDMATERSFGAEYYAVGQLGLEPDGRIGLQFRLWDLVAGRPVEQLRFLSDRLGQRRVAHKVSDVIYSALTGEGPYFDSRVVFVDERGPKNARVKNLAIMDQDGANLTNLTNNTDPLTFVLTPRFSPVEQLLTYVEYRNGDPRVMLMSLASVREESILEVPGIAFAPRFSPDGGTVIMSLSRGGVTDLFTMRIADRAVVELTRRAGISTGPSFKPDGSAIVFESDWSGTQQLYVMPPNPSAEPQRISFGQGSYATPVWSPSDDFIAFTNIRGGRFHIGVMRPDGTEERLLTESFIDEGPAWSPNGRVILFFRETPGEQGRSQLYTVDVFGRAIQPLPTPNGASDPAWSPLLG